MLVTQGTSTAPCEGQGRWGPQLCGGRSPTSSAHFSAEACQGEGEGRGEAVFSQFGLLGEGKLPEAPYRATQGHSGAVGEAGSLGCHPLHEVCLCRYACTSMRVHSSSAGDEPRGQCTGTGLLARGSQKVPKGAGKTQGWDCGGLRDGVQMWPDSPLPQREQDGSETSC